MTRRRHVNATSTAKGRAVRVGMEFILPVGDVDENVVPPHSDVAAGKSDVDSGNSDVSPGKF